MFSVKALESGHDIDAAGGWDKILLV